MDIDFKIITWDRATIDDKDKDKVLDALKKGLIKNSSDLHKFTEDPQWESAWGGEQQMTVEQNGGSATIEAEIDSRVVYCNSINLEPSKDN